MNELMENLFGFEGVLFEEIGRKVSKDRETKLRAALQAIRSALSDLDDAEDGDEDSEKAAESAIVRATEQLMEALSHSDQQSRLETAIKALYPDDYVMVVDVFNNDVIYRHMPKKRSRYDEYDYPDYSASTLYRLSWVENNNRVTVGGTPVKVVHRTIYDDVNDSSPSPSPLSAASAVTASEAELATLSESTLEDMLALPLTEGIKDTIKKVLNRIRGKSSNAAKTQKRWVHKGTEAACEPCQKNVDAGLINEDASFPSTWGEYEKHPNCHCEIETVKGAIEADNDNSADIEAAYAVLVADEDIVGEEAKTKNRGSMANIVTWMKKNGGAHPHSACTAKFGGKVSNVDAFCAAAVDQMKGTTKWRGKEEGVIDIETDTVALTEKAIRKDGTVLAKLIDPGWGSSGYYSAELLKRDGPKIFVKGTHMYADHPTMSEDAERPERSIKDLSGVLVSDATWLDNGPNSEGPGLYASIQPVGIIKETLEDLAPHIGLSIRARGKASIGEAEGRKGHIVDSLVSASSVDFVTKAGRGGKVLQLAESVRGVTSPTNENRNVNMDPNTATIAEMTEALKNATNALKERDEQDSALKAEVAELRRERLVAEAEKTIRTAVKARYLPEATQERIVDALVARVPIKEGKVDTEMLESMIEINIANEVAYAAKLGVSGSPIRKMGESVAEMRKQEADNVQTRYEEVFGKGGFGLSEAVTGRRIVG